MCRELLPDVNGLTAEEQPPDLIRQLVIAHDVNLPLIECGYRVDSTVDEIKQIAG